MQFVKEGRIKSAKNLDRKREFVRLRREKDRMDQEHHWTREELRQAVERLSAREKLVMTLRFGLLDEQDQTIEEVGKRLQVTRERVRQIEERAWRKLKQDGPDGDAGAFVKRT